MNVNNDESPAMSEVPNENSTPLACSICSKEFSSEKRYFGHLRIHSGEVLWCCDKCPHSNTVFDSQSRLKSHENACHVPSRPHKCPKCNDVFDRASQLDYHIRSVHLGEKSQICQICGKGFFRKTDLRTHLNVHLGTNQSICEICGRKFNHVSNLIRHCRTHAGSKPYPCMLCGKRFTQISSLTRHKRIHERESSVVFDKNQNDQESTIRINKFEKDCNEVEEKKSIKRQHYCRMCGESFQFMVLLRQHERLHCKKAENYGSKVYKKEREFSIVENIKEAEQTEVLLNTSRGNDWRDFSTEKETNSEEMEKLEPVSIREHLMELDRKMNAIEIESERDVSISISDILSPYDCDEIELSNTEGLEPKLYDSSSVSSKHDVLEKEYDIAQCLNGVDFTSNIDNQLLEVSNEKSTVKFSTRAKLQTKEVKTSVSKQFASMTKEQYSNKCLHVEGGQLWIEICESEYLKSSQLQALELQEIENVALLQDVFGVTNTESAESSTPKFQKDSSEKSTNNDYENTGTRIDTIDPKEPTLRLVQTETGDQFYELLIHNNNQCNENFVSMDTNENSNREISQDDNSESDPNLSTPACDDNSEILTQKHSDDLEKFQNEFVSNSNEFVQFLPNTENSREMCGTSSQNDSHMPMVRLVQNEDGEQFFELIREPLEYERNRSVDDISVDEKSLESTIDTEKSRLADNSKSEIAVTNTVLRKEKKKGTKDTLQRTSCKNRTRKFQCPECDKWFSTAYNFKQHAGTHFSDKQQFQCKECGLSFAWKSTLNKHLAGNHRPDGPQKFVCEICPKVYSTLSQVNEHVKRDHLKQRNHVCPHCGKSFFKKFDLKTHSRTHTNERPYVCRACGKRFHHQSHIIRHERIHSGERPYTCNICQRTFTQPGSLKAHRQRHRDVNKIDILEYRMDEDDPLSLAVQ